MLYALLQRTEEWLYKLFRVAQLDAAELDHCPICAEYSEEEYEVIEEANREARQLEEAHRSYREAIETPLPPLVLPPPPYI